MRTLNTNELKFVSGGEGTCGSDDGGNVIVGVSEPASLGKDLIGIYESLIEATSYMIERVANAFG